MQRRSLLMRLAVFLGFALALQLGVLSSARADNGKGKGRDEGKGNDEGRGNDDSEIRVKRGFEIAPVELDLRGKNRSLVGLGSYIVNAEGGCNGCHTHPSYVPDKPGIPGGNPFKGQPEKINTENYLAGGRQFGPVITSANITPDASGKPAGLTLGQFITTLRTGHNPNDPPNEILQVMPWPEYGKMIDRDLHAIYEYLSAIPSLQDNPNPGP